MPESTRGDLPPLHVLVVEDDEDQREHLASVLTACGCRVDTAPDGASALRKLERSRPDVVLMDLGMPIIDGWDAIRRIRRASAKAGPYIIAFSAFQDAESRRMAFAAGCDEYIVKPLDVKPALRAYVVRRAHRAMPNREDSELSERPGIGTGAWDPPAEVASR